MHDQYIIAQIGARRGYAVPAILEQNGMLEQFYTDVCADLGLGRPLAALGKGFGATGRLKQLASRQLPLNIRGKTTTFAGPTVWHEFRHLLGINESGSGPGAYPVWSAEMGRAMIRKGFGSATHLYSMLDECGPLLAEAQRQGLRVVTEIYILLATERILSAERKAFPEWEISGVEFPEMDSKFPPEDRLLKDTDFAICPSEAVRKDLTTRCGFPVERTRIVPYGMSPDWLNLPPQPKRGRVLFVGAATLRKGIHYLALAAEKLAAAGNHYEFRIVGNVTDRVRRQPVCRHLTFLGHLSRVNVQEEFQKADIFVLPSLAEGSAEVTYEALAAGVPLVVTHATGSVARDGLEALIIPERNPHSLAEAIQQLVEDRNLRDRFAYAARELARDYTWERYGQRLVAALHSFSDTSKDS